MKSCYTKSLLVDFLSDEQIAEAQDRADAEPRDGLVVSDYLSGVIKKFVKSNPNVMIEDVEPVSEFRKLLATPLHELAAQKDIDLDSLEFAG